LTDDLAVLDAPPEPAPRRKARQRAPTPPSSPWTAGQWMIVCLIPIMVAAGVLIGMSSKHTQAVGRQALETFFQAILSWYLAYGARAYFRRRAWLFGSGMALVSVLTALSAFASASGIAEKLGAGRAFMGAFVTVVFALLAATMAYGVRNAFRRRSWLLGSAFLLFAIFLTLCAIQAALDLAKPR
jgi:hypothetical protein